MTLGLVVACLWVIFRRSALPWRTAWRMFMVLIVTSFASAIILPVLPGRYTKPAQLFAALVSLTAAIATGFYQAKRYPKVKAPATLK